MQKIDLAIFDMAGTTVDEQNVVYQTLQKVINQQGFDFSLDDVLRIGAGKEKRQAIMDVLRELAADVTDLENIAHKAFEQFKPTLKSAYAELEVKTFPGVDTFLRDLRKSGVKVVLSTGYDRLTAETLLGKLNWQINDVFDTLITADDISNSRPHPEMIYQAMHQFGITDSNRVLKAGDSLIDIEEGKNADCGITVGVLSGAQTHEQLAQGEPTYILASVADLRDILLATE